MYLLEYNTASAATTRRLYMFPVTDTAGDGYFNVLDIDTGGRVAWKEIKGNANAVSLRFDPVEENGIFTPIIKTSLEVQLYRENEQDFYDIIEAEENTYYAVLLEGCELDFVTGTNQLYIKGTTPKLLFKGALTNETYGEAYLPLPTVNIIFHDRIGELSDIEFSPTSPQMRLTDILAECLNTCPASYKLFIEFPFDVDTLQWKNLTSPYNLLLDVTLYNGEKKLDVLTDVLETFGYNLFVDHDEWTVAYSTYPHLRTAGAIRLRLVDQFTEQTNFYFDYTLTETDGVYTYEEEYEAEDVQTEEFRTPLKIGNGGDYLIINRTGKWQLARRAKWIEAKNIFQIKDNYFFPNEFILEDFFYSAPETQYNGGQYNLQYKYWITIPILGFDPVDVKGYIANQNTGQRAFSNTIGPENKLGVIYKNNASIDYRIMLMTNSILVNKCDYLFNIDVEVFSLQEAPQLNIVLYAVHGEDLYAYDSSGNEWLSSGSITPLTWDSFNANEYLTHSFSEIPQPADIPDGEHYNIILLIYDENTLGPIEDQAYITGFKMYFSDIIDVPKKLTIKTIISDTKRKPIEFESKFYNLPDIPGNTSIYASGILATGLDYYVGGDVDEENSSQIVAPATLKYEGNNGTMLVHLSDMVGQQHETDRWVFEADVIANPVAPAATWYAEWRDYICEKAFSYKTALTNLLGFWRFNEGTGTTIGDETANNLDGSIAAGDVYWDDTRFIEGESLFFDGNSCDLGEDTMNGVFDGKSGLTISAWVRPASFANPFGYIFTSIINGVLNGFSIRLRLNQKIEVLARSGAADSAATCTGSQTLDLNTWYHVVATVNYATKTVKLFIDGVLDNSIKATFANTVYTKGNATIKDRIGGYISGATIYNYAGNIDDVRVYDKALTDTEVNQIYYEHSGYKRHETLRLIKSQLGEVVDGYPVDYDFTAAFGVLPALTSEQFAQLSEANFNTRLAAFRTKIETEEGIDPEPYEVNDARELNTESCPLPNQYYTLTLESDPDSTGTPGFYYQSPDSTHKAGDQVLLTAADNPPDGWFYYWKYNGAAVSNSEEYLFTMPAANATVYAFYSDEE